MSDGTGFPQASSPQEVLATLAEMRTGDADWRSGRTFSLVYHSDHHEHEELLEEVGRQFLHENALNPFAFPSLLQMEREVVGAAAALTHADEPLGRLSSGGTESIFLAVQTARDHARATRGLTATSIVTPTTAHPAFAKACKYLDVIQVKVPVGDDLRVDVAAMAAAIDDTTALVVGSAPNYPYGTVDDIGAIAALATDHGVLCHVDACLGGWVLPFWERLGEPVPTWDFRIPGVTSISMDVHKYGYAFKGASVILHRHKETLEQQFFLYDDWPGGLYGSATTAGTRSAAPIAGAWAAVHHLGESGYLALAEKVRDATKGFVAGIDAIDGLAVTGRPDGPTFEFGSSDPSVDIGAVGDAMDDKGWHLDRQQGGLHMIVFPFHVHVVDEVLADLADAVAAGGESRGKRAVYGAADTD